MRNGKSQCPYLPTFPAHPPTIHPPRRGPRPAAGGGRLPAPSELPASAVRAPGQSACPRSSPTSVHSRRFRMDPIGRAPPCAHCLWCCRSCRRVRDDARLSVLCRSMARLFVACSMLSVACSVLLRKWCEPVARLGSSIVKTAFPKKNQCCCMQLRRIHEHLRRATGVATDNNERLFRLFDKDGSGFITMAELHVRPCNVQRATQRIAHLRNGMPHAGFHCAHTLVAVTLTLCARAASRIADRPCGPCYR